MSIHSVNLYGICVKPDELRPELQDIGDVFDAVMSIFRKEDWLPEGIPDVHELLIVNDYYLHDDCSAIIGFSPIMPWEATPLTKRECHGILQRFYKYLANKEDMPEPKYYNEAWNDC